MKISEFNTNESLDLLCALTPNIAAFLKDKELLDELKKKRGTVGKMTVAEMLQVAASRLNVLVPILFQKHRSDLFSILAAMNKTTPDAIAAQPLVKTMEQMKEILQDRDFWDFFGISAKLKQNR